LGNEV
jgi:hypothetical protein